MNLLAILAFAGVYLVLWGIVSGIMYLGSLLKRKFSKKEGE
jgi:hypothetical protein